MTTLAPPEEIVTSLNFTGGFPSSKDFVPSIIMTIAYGLTLPLLIYRGLNHQSRSIILLRPAAFAVIRMTSLVMRADMARTPYSLDVLITELVLVSVGFLFLVEPLVALWKRSVDCNYPPGTAPLWVPFMNKLLHFSLVGAFITGIIATTQTASSFDQGGRVISSTLSLRHASYCLSFIVVLFTTFATIYGHYRLSIPSFRTVYLLLVLICLLVTSSYRVAQTFSTDPSSRVRQPLAYWICQIFFEFVTYLTYLIVSIPDAFPSLLILPPLRTRSFHLASSSEKGQLYNHHQTSSINQQAPSPTIRIRPRPLNRISTRSTTNSYTGDAAPTLGNSTITLVPGLNDNSTLNVALAASALTFEVSTPNMADLSKQVTSSVGGGQHNHNNTNGIAINVENADEDEEEGPAQEMREMRELSGGSRMNRERSESVTRLRSSSV